MSDIDRIDIHRLRVVHGWRAAGCRDRECKLIHVVLFDKDENPFACIHLASDDITELRRCHRELISQKSDPNWKAPHK